MKSTFPVVGNVLGGYDNEDYAETGLSCSSTSFI